MRSAQNKWPTKSDPQSHKFYSLEVELCQKTTTINRSTYSILDWIGDIGGLFDGLYFIGSRMLGPIAAFAMKAELFTLFSEHSEPKKSEEVDTKPIKSFKTYCRRKSRYRQILKKVESKVMRQLDLVRFVKH